MRQAIRWAGTAGWVIIALAAGGQETVSPRELLAENDRLIRELRDVRALLERYEAELVALRNERRGLEIRVRDAESMLSGVRRELGGEPADAPISPDHGRAPVGADPLGSPAALLRELRNRYFEAVRDLPDATDADRESYRQQVALWCRLMNRELRGRRTWLVEFDDVVPLPDGRAVARMTLLDEPSGLLIGDPVDVAVPRKFAERAGEDDRWLLTAVVIAAPAYSEQRLSRGVFEYPPFVGPYVEFDFELDWIALREWRPGQSSTVEEPEAAEPGDAEPAVENAPAGG